MIKICTLTASLCLLSLVAMTPLSAQDMRVLDFPANESYGFLNVLKQGWVPSTVGQDITREAYPARGQIKIARSKNLSLTGSYALSEHLEILKRLPADSLTRLDLGKLSFRSRDLANVSHLTGLQSLDLDQTDIDDSALPSIKPLINLEYLSISRTLLKGKTLDALVTLKKLKRLHLSHCDLDLNTLSPLSKLVSLHYLHASALKISDTTIDVLKPLTNLEDLRIDGNNAITDNGVKKLSCLKHLRFLDLADSKVTEAGILALKGLPLISIKLANTKVTGASKTKLKKAFPRCLIEYAKDYHAQPELFAPLH